VSKFQHHTNLCSKYNISLLSSFNVSPISWKSLLLVKRCFYHDKPGFHFRFRLPIVTNSEYMHSHIKKTTASLMRLFSRPVIIFTLHSMLHNCSPHNITMSWTINPSEIKFILHAANIIQVPRLTTCILIASKHVLILKCKYNQNWFMPKAKCLFQNGSPSAIHTH